jgi:hypothetical protein
MMKKIVQKVKDSLWKQSSAKLCNRARVDYLWLKQSSQSFEIKDGINERFEELYH